MKKRVFSYFIIIFLIVVFSSLINANVDLPQNYLSNNINADNLEFQGLYGNFSLNEKENKLDYSGYLIEFNEEPLIQKYNELNKEVQDNKEYIEQSSWYNPVRIYKQAFGLSSNNVDSKVKTYEKQLENSHEQTKSRILNKVTTITGNAILNQEDDVQSFTKVFNGISLNISDEQAKEIEKISGVKKVYPNLNVQANLMDSVPLIGADDVWQLDKDGNNCAESGKDCLTGKNVTIAIIDTGVDYTHGDLGGSYNILDLSKKIDGIHKGNHLNYYNNSIVYEYFNSTGLYIFYYNLIDKSEKEIPRLDNYFLNSPNIYGNKIVYLARNASGLFPAKLYLFNIKDSTKQLIDYIPYQFPEITNDTILYLKQNGTLDDLIVYNYIQDNRKTITTSEIYYYLINGNFIIFKEKNSQNSLTIKSYNINTRELKVIDNGNYWLSDLNNNTLLYIDGQTKYLYSYNLITSFKSLVLRSKQVSHAEFDYNNIVYTDTSNNLFVKDGDKISLIAKNVNAFKPNNNSIIFNLESIDPGFNSDIYIHLYNSSKDYGIHEISFNSKVIGGYDFVNNDNDPMDDNGHGTHVAATAAGNGTLKGVAPDANILAYKVLDSSGRGSFSNIISAIERAVDPNQDNDFSDKADIISMSLGADCMNYYGRYNDECGPDDALSQAVDNAVEAGVVAVISAGNSGPGEQTIGSPGTARKAITIGAVDKSDNIAGFSSRGPVIINEEYIIKPDVVAPGVSICAAQYDSAWSNSQCLDDKHVAISGTSMATPMVAGAVALLKQKNPDWTPEEIKSALKATAIDLNLPINVQGYGRINILNSIRSSKPSVAKIVTSGLIENIIDLYGTAMGDNFVNYSLYYGDGYDPVSWQFIYSSTIPVNDNVIYSQFDPSVLEDGKHSLMLRVFNRDNSYSEDRSIIEIDNLKISSPLNNDILRVGDVIAIKGTVNVYGLENYKIEYARGLDPTNMRWNSDGIFLTNGGILNITGGILANWNTTGLVSDFYTLRLTITTTDGESKMLYVQRMFLDDLLKNGWPQYMLLKNGSTDISSHIIPNVADIDKDGFKEIVVVDTSGSFEGNLAELRVYNYDGSVRWTKQIQIAYSYSTPILGDLDNDGFMEIIVEMNSFNENNGRLYAYKYDGTLLEGWPILFNYFVKGTILADLNNDNNLEIISRTLFWNYSTNVGQELINIYNNKGNLINSIGLFVGPSFGDIDGIESFPAVGNFDNDSDLEIAVYYNFTSAAVYNVDGTMLEGWPVSTGGIISFFSFTTGDINKDGYSELIFTAFNLSVPGYFDSKAGGIYVFDRFGNSLPGWPVLLDKSFYTNAVLGDVDNDGYPEIVASTSENFVYLLDRFGNVNLGWPIANGYAPTRISPSIADINNDGNSDIIISAGGIQPALLQCGWLDGSGGIRAWNANGSPIDFSSYDESNTLFGELLPISPLVITDIDNNGYLDLISTTESNVAWCPLKSSNANRATSCNENDKNIDDDCIVSSKGRGSIYVRELNVPYNSNKAPWPMYQHDPQHTGCYDCEQVVNTCNDSDGKNYSVKSTLVFNNLNYTDYCNKSFVVEYYCEDNNMNFESFNCTYGCNDGACKSQIPENKDIIIDGTKVTLNYKGTAPFLINIRGDSNIGQDGGYLVAETYSSSFNYDLIFAKNPSNLFYYSIKAGNWSEVRNFSLQ